MTAHDPQIRESDEFMRVAATAARAIWADMSARCPRAAKGQALYCTHPDNPLWTRDCEFDACPFVRQASTGETE